ncbi:hypothetical protein ACXAUS_004088 [Clostridium sporogenes]
MKLSKFKFDTNLGLVEIDGKRIDFVTDINITSKSGQSFSTVTLVFEADAEVEGDTLILPHLIGRKRTIEKFEESLYLKQHKGSELIMNIKNIKTYEKTRKRIQKASKENKQMALQIINLMSSQDMTSCNAEIVLSLCHDLIEINSKITAIK